MKNLLTVFFSLLVLASCLKKEDDPIAVESVSLLPAGAVILNGTYELKATVSPVNAADKSLSWNSDNSAIASVDQNGVVTGKVLGKTIITVTSKSDPDKSAKCEVQVVRKKAVSIAITPEKPVITEGDRLELKAAVLPAEAAQTVTWSSKGPAKATIDPATGVVSNVEAGTVLIIATANDGSTVKGEITLTVQSKSAAAITGITLGTENFVVAVPNPGAATKLNNAPHTIAADLTKVPVNITTTAGAIIKIGTTAFSSGQPVDFTNSVTFSVSEKGKTGDKNYTLTITPYSNSNPYGVYNMAHLNDVRSALSAGFKLINDITLPAAGTGFAGIGDYDQAGWLPIGGHANPFTGSLDGDGHKINGFYTNRSERYVGLFGKVGSGASIKKLEVIGVTGTNTTAATGTLTLTSGGYQYTGILAGVSEGTIEDCYASGNVSSSSSNTSAAGGLVGHCNSGTISNCYASGNAVAAVAAGDGSALAGGLVGHCLTSTISKCYATGNPSASATSGSALAGGLLGLFETTSTNVTNCYATGNSSSSVSSSSGTSIAGGLVGQSKNGGTISNCYTVANVSIAAGGSTTSSHVGGFVGHNSGSTFSNCYRNYGASIKLGNDVVEPSDKGTSGINGRLPIEIYSSVLKISLNGRADTDPVWGYTQGKNNDLPYIKGVGVGK